MGKTSKKEDIQIYNPDLYKEELDIIDSDLDEIDRLYREIKDHYTDIKNSHARGSLTFIEKQTSNLISLKTAKLNFIKEKMNIKSNVTNFALKQKQMEKDDEETSGIDGYSKAIFDAISNNFKYNLNDNTSFNENNSYIENEEDIDRELNKAIENEEDKSTSYSIPTINSSNNKIVYSDNESRFLLVDSDYNIIDDNYEVENYTVIDIRKNEEDGSSYLITDRGDFEIVTLEE